MYRTRLATLLLLVLATVHLSHQDEGRFIKKYAMMKVYESCYGIDVVRQLKKEMQAACARCQGNKPTSSPSPMPPANEVDNSNEENESGEQNIPKLETVFGVAPGGLSQGLNPSLVPFPGPYRQFNLGQPSHSFVPYQQNNAPLYYPQLSQLTPFLQQLQNQQFYYQPGFYSQFPRGSRALGVAGQLESFKSRFSDKISNITCVMRDLGYLDADNQPNYQAIANRISILPIDNMLKRDMIEGIEYCKQFSQCVPEKSQSAFSMHSKEMSRAFTFFKCYKNKKLEACIMKDARERYGAQEAMQETNENEGLRSAREAPEDMAAAVYEIIYGENKDESEFPGAF